MAHDAPSLDDEILPFDAAFAEELIGKYVLIGLTVEDKRGQVKRQEQFHGTVLSADPNAGIQLALHGSNEGKTKWLPPATHVFNAAPKGTYSLRTTGESVWNPDFTATWRIEQPDA